MVESGAARLMRMRTSLALLIENAAGVLGAVIAMKSARWTVEEDRRGGTGRTSALWGGDG